jgi:predicted enzyme related to lactoylglutathione lyase
MTTHFKGIYTALYRVDDLERGKAWYAQALGTAPYFDQPFYVGFNVAGFELGLLPPEPGAAMGAGGTVAYWGVEDVQAAWNRLIALGATGVEKPQDVGADIVVAAVRDPFGNLFGLIRNPHFPNTA